MPEIQFSSISDFLNMGGYALYVWSSYAIFAVLMGVSLIQPRLARRRIIRQQRARMLREENREEQS